MIKQLFEKILCKHQWKTEKELGSFGYGKSQENGDHPYRIQQLRCCKTCGKIKIIDFFY